MLIRWLLSEYLQWRQGLRTLIAVIIAVVLQQTVFVDVAQSYWLVIAAVMLPQLYQATLPPRRWVFLVASGIAVILTGLGVLAQLPLWLSAGYLAVVLAALCYGGIRFRYLKAMAFYLSLLTALSVGLPAVLSDCLPRAGMVLLGAVLAFAVSYIGMGQPAKQTRYQLALVLRAINRFFQAAQQCLLNEDYYQNRRPYEHRLLKRRHSVLWLFDNLPVIADPQGRQLVDLLQQLFAAVLAFANIRYRYHSAQNLAAMHTELGNSCRMLTAAMQSLQQRLLDKTSTVELDWASLAAAVQPLQGIVAEAMETQAALGPVVWTFENRADNNLEITFAFETHYALQAMLGVIDAQVNLLQELFNTLSTQSGKSGGAA